MAKPREASAISFGISGCRMSQSFVKRDTTPSKLSGATNYYGIELEPSLWPGTDQMRVRLRVSRAWYHYNRYLVKREKNLKGARPTFGHFRRPRRKVEIPDR